MRFFKEIKEQITSIDIAKKELWRSVLFLGIIYVVAYISIFRANYSYVDDIVRTVRGDDVCGTFSRHISEFLSYFIHTTTGRLTDVSPLPQLIACVFLALTGYVLVKVITGTSTKYLLLATLPIGLSPYFLECISYKFDSPYMALSVLVSVFPFLFMNANRWIYTSVSIISLLIMTTTYQASSGVFLMMVLYFFFRTILYKSDSLKNAFIFLGISVLSYGIALGIFQISFSPAGTGYATTSLASNNIVSLFWFNLTKYFSYIHKDWNTIWKIVAGVVVIIWYAKTIIFSKLNKIFAFFVTTLFLALLAGSIFGVYVLLEKPLFAPRAMYGTGIFLAILGVDICFSLKKLFSFPVMVLSWCFLVFAFAYGNCLADQKRYKEFRSEILIHDLSHLLPNDGTTYKLTMCGNIGLSGVSQNVFHNNPIIRRLLNTNISTISLASFHNFSLERNLTPSMEKDKMPVVFDSFYHTIKRNDNEIVVIWK